MYDEILVPTDGSDVAERAGTLAVRMATFFDADLTVVSVEEPGDAARAERAVEAIEETAREAGLTPRTEIIDPEEAIHRAIIDAAEEHGADVVVMGTHGRTGIGRFLLGSVAEQTIQESPIPIVTVHEDTVIDLEVDAVLVPTDGSTGAEAATDHAIDLAADTGATIHALYATSGGREANPSPVEGVRERAEAAGVEVVTATRRGRPYESIAGYVAEANIDIVVMGSHGRTGLRRYLLGSVTERTVRFSPVPVVTVKPTQVSVTVAFLDYAVLEDEGWSLDDEDLFRTAAAADLPAEAYGELTVGTGEYILEAAEAEGYDWPFYCRGGGCINCAAVLVDGEVEMEVNRSLSDEEVDEMNLRLTCVARPTSDEVRLVYNAKHLDQLRSRVI